MKLGLDIGSTTLKCVLLDDENALLFKSYERHFSKPLETLEVELDKVRAQFGDLENLHLALSGSAAMGFAETLGAPFIQEVFATKIAAESYLKSADIIIELGGEDAKILFLSGGLEVRMNGSCAGGTGAFIDQMSTLLDISPIELNEMAKTHEKTYQIASRCGVFAKSDIQPLLNQGARKEDVSASIFKAVVNQTIAGLAQGRELKGNIVYLGGPLTFLTELRNSFDETLHTNGTCPENSLYYVALGAGILAEQEATVTLDSLISRVAHHKNSGNYATLPPLFDSAQEYAEFEKRHAQATVATSENHEYDGKAFLGIDIGSTTVKMVALDEKQAILFSRYAPNGGSPIPLVKKFLEEFYDGFPHAHIAASASTGYGEEMTKQAFSLDFGIVETIAHFKAAKKFDPHVDFIIDIGGQDIKCFKIVDGAIDDIFLNEACSSGCGSFLQSFAAVLDYSLEDFAKLGLFAKSPVDLGSRCTVFMNSNVKQAQKDGATIEDISAGLSVSVVKNALYKVIRATTPSELGENIVVQGGTFLNGAVLRAFEKEIKRPVVRPVISGLMGAYGAALYAMDNMSPSKATTTLTGAELSAFSHTVRSVTCKLCGNHCSLTINNFGGNRKFVGGNRCERPISHGEEEKGSNLFAFKQTLLESYRQSTWPGKRGKIGIPLALNMYELLPFWNAFFKSLDFEIVVSPFSSHELYLKAQHTIPSDTVCYPAKLSHGHIQYLLDEGCTNIFYPCMTYNIDEHLGDNNYNCPVVAYYPEVIQANVPEVKDVTFIYDYIGIHRPKDFVGKMHEILNKYFDGISKNEVKTALDAAYEEHTLFLEKTRKKATEIVSNARAAHKPIIVIAGRPYHLDPEVNHGIDKLVIECGAALITEDSVSHLVASFKTNVLNQWTYHSRLYAAARYVTTQPDMNLVQLVSFGCGVDAITTDEVRSILRAGKKIYTQIKIDEITNLGAVKIRLRSLFAVLSERQ